jgi:hypothetical protein
LLPWPVALILVILINALSLTQLPNLRLNNAPEVYYEPGSPAVVLRDKLRRDFPSDELLTVVFQGDDLYGRDFLTRLDGLTRKLQAHPMVDRVTSVTTMERISGTADGFAIEPLVDVKRLAQASPDVLRKRVLNDRFAPGLLASRDGRVMAMVVRPKPLGESGDRLALKVAVALAINQAGLRSHFAGDAGPLTLDVAQLQSILQDSAFFIPATSVLGLVLLAWVVGRWRPVVIGGVAMSTVVLPVVAGFSALGLPYTMASAILPSLLAAYTLATLMHLYAGIQQAQAAGLSRAECVDRALGDTMRPGAFNVLTTGAGLLSLVFVPLPPIQAFGIAGALGTLLVFVTVFVLAPPFLARWDNRRWPTKSSTMGRFDRIAARLTLTAMRRPKLVLIGAVAVCIAALPLARDVQVESDVLTFFAADHEVNRHVALVEAQLSGVTTLEISLTGKGADSLQNLGTMQRIRDLQRWLEQQPWNARTTSMVDLVEEMHWAMNGERRGFRDLPQSDRLLKQYLLVYDGSDLGELVNRDYDHARILMSIDVHGAQQIGRVIDAINAHVATQPIPDVSVEVGGYGRMFADQVGLLVDGQIHSFASAFLQIFLFMALLWRSWGASALCLVPNLAPLYFVFVLMGATGINLDLATVMIAGVILGITVDDTIHLYHGYKRRKDAGASVPLALARSFRSSGRAVLAISVLLTAQFGLLATSDFIPSANFGLMTAVGLLAGQAAELLLLPALLILKDGRRGAPVVKTSGFDRRTRSRWPVTSETLWPPKPVVAAAAVPAVAIMDAPLGDRLLICRGETCRARGANEIWQRSLDAYVGMKARGDASGAMPVEVACLRQCEHAPVVQLARAVESIDGADAKAIADLAVRHVSGRTDVQAG